MGSHAYPRPCTCRADGPVPEVRIPGSPAADRRQHDELPLPQVRGPMDGDALNGPITQGCAEPAQAPPGRFEWRSPARGRPQEGSCGAIAPLSLPLRRHGAVVGAPPTCQRIRHSIPAAPDYSTIRAWLPRHRAWACKMVSCYSAMMHSLTSHLPVIASAFGAVALVALMFRRHLRRHSTPTAPSPGRLVIAANLVRSTHRDR